MAACHLPSNRFHSLFLYGPSKLTQKQRGRRRTAQAQHRCEDRTVDGLAPLTPTCLLAVWRESLRQIKENDSLKTNRQHHSVHLNIYKHLVRKKTYPIN